MLATLASASICHGALGRHILPSAAAAQHDLVSDAPCVLGDELQQHVDGSSGMLVHYVAPAAQQDPACQPAVRPEPVHQPGHSPARSSLLPLDSLQGNQPGRAAVYSSGVGPRPLTLTVDVSVSRGRPCLRPSENVGAPVCSGCLKQVGRGVKSG